MASVGSTMSNINEKILGELPIAVPDNFDEQESINTQFSLANKELGELTAEATQAIALLKERRAALISAAVTGKIDVRNLVEPAAEPAIAA